MIIRKIALKHFTGFVFLIAMIPAGAFGQADKMGETEKQSKLYNRAIEAFLKGVYQRNKTIYDTVFVLLRKNKQKDDFPDVSLEESIGRTHIRKIAPTVPEIKSKKLNKRIYINLIGWIQKENADFMVVVFSNGFSHQYDYSVSFKWNKSKGVSELVKSQYMDVGK